MSDAAPAQVFLRAGELVVCRQPSVVTTILGSCVAVTMFHRPYRVAAMCHAMLPSLRPGAPAGDALRLMQYVSHAVPAMCQVFRELGVSPHSVEVKVFGGGDVLPIVGGRPPDFRIGPGNVELARRILAAEGMVVTSFNVGGTTGRKIIFDTQTGGVRLKHLEPLAFAS